MPRSYKEEISTQPTGCWFTKGNRVSVVKMTTESLGWQQQGGLSQSPSQLIPVADGTVWHLCPRSQGSVQLKDHSYSIMGSQSSGYVKDISTIIIIHLIPLSLVPATSNKELNEDEIYTAVHREKTKNKKPQLIYYTETPYNWKPTAKIRSKYFFCPSLWWLPSTISGQLKALSLGWVRSYLAINSSQLSKN